MSSINRVRLEVKVSTKDVLSSLNDVVKGIKSAVEDETLKWLQDLTVYALNIKPWKDRTGMLRAGHRIEQREGGWQLAVNPENVGASYNYGPILEFGWGSLSRAFPWIGPAYDAMEPQLDGRIRSRINDVIRGSVITTTHVIKGKTRTVRRWGAGTVIGGKRVGGRFAPKV